MSETKCAGVNHGSPPCPETEADKLWPYYQLAVEMADRISQRRQAANTFGLTLNSALVSAGGALLAIDRGHPTLWFIVLAVVGVWESLIWAWMIRSYRQLNTAKYTIIHELEAKLPVALYKQEWDQVEHGRSRSRYWPISHVESLAPWGFVVIYIASALLVVWGLLV